MDLDKLRLAQNPSETPRAVSKAKRLMDEPFLKGPVPIRWLSAAARLGGSSLEVGINLWYRHGLNRDKPFKIGLDEMGLHQISRDTARRAINSLEHAGLIELMRERGKKIVIQIKNKKSQVQEMDV